MIISASRRTDIPSCYADWFFNRVQEGFVYTRNPKNYHQVSRISLEIDKVDGIVFWTKNPLPMLPRLQELSSFPYYFQYTLTPYGRDIEPSVPPKIEVGIPSFCRLSDTIGPDRVIWRYDPILVTTFYSIDYHLRYFTKMAGLLKGYTNRCTISFLDLYSNMRKNTDKLGLIMISEKEQHYLCENFSSIAHANGMEIDTCSESIDTSRYGMGHARCIDDRLLEKIGGKPLTLSKDKNQRLECGCVTSKDIGMYDTCCNGCLYCYATRNTGQGRRNNALHDPHSPLLIGTLSDGDELAELTHGATQLTLF
ncbi:protein of unknown function (DUF1848) [Sphaerochaeta pleomorpha str. Grapes]|uniref:DNA repair photolyase n=1 Tax=Sphaerochaeta pleomorpha (strain ATCC BAA-1885 / DSM 22778 / Grapes) TaxID=158190 RepID=G8QVL4_SPHPG|nr:DUF1848 domain-containing protein [Sphaerochaeta pleomorpha]AEV28247.1 protein of unknown function (DUF1848) [Sphaerochaeta pleomorpha str. Grapes]